VLDEDRRRETGDEPEARLVDLVGLSVIGT